MSENPYRSPRPVVETTDTEALRRAERLPFRCAFGGASIGSAAGALGTLLLKLIALGFALAEGRQLAHPPRYERSIDTAGELAVAFLAELVVELIPGTLIGIFSGAVVGGALGTAALFWPARWLRLHAWFSAALSTVVGGLLGYAFGGLSIASGALALGSVPMTGLCAGAVLGLLSGTLLGRGIRKRVERDLG